MTIDQISIFCIIIFTFILFVWGKLRYDIVSIIALSTLYITDLLLGSEKSNLIIDTSNIFSGFSHPAVISVIVVLIISKALRNAGVIDFIWLEGRVVTEGDCRPLEDMLVVKDDAPPEVEKILNVLILLSSFINDESVKFLLFFEKL